MLKVGVIGAGHISASHIKAYKAAGCEVAVVVDINIDNAKTCAEEYDIKNYCCDYKEILKDETIDAVSVVTPTFTHKDIVIDALRSGKHVLCEKPPALNADEVRECEKVAKETGKLLMFGMVCRFHNTSEYLKKYISAGRFGDFVSAECIRTSRCTGSSGWFASRKKGGGPLRDECIHEIDLVMYLMGYPKPKYVVANESFANQDLPSRLNRVGWVSFDKNAYKRDIESSIEGFILLDNGASLKVKSSHILNTLSPGRSIELIGEKSGMMIGTDGSFKMLEIVDDCYIESKPDVTNGASVECQIKHFVDCIVNGTECKVKTSEAVILMEIIDALYKSAATKQPVIFE